MADDAKNRLQEVGAMYIALDGGDAEQATDAQKRRRGLAVYAGRVAGSAVLVASGLLAYDAYQNFQQPTEQQPQQSQVEQPVDQMP